jgi:sugar-specific transcriptional regulator TrmB
LAIQDQDAQTLVGLGLTLLQARVYLALAKSGDATIKTIATVSKVARQDIYRVIGELHNLGLVEKLVDAPSKFRAIPIRECVFILLQNRIKKTTQLQQEASELILHFDKDKTDTEPKEEESQFVIINELQARRVRSKKSLEIVQKSLKVVTKLSIFTSLMFALAEDLAKAMDRGVRVQMVVGRSKSEIELPEAAKAFLQNPLFCIRYVRTVPSSVFAIYDDREVILQISKNVEQMAEAPILWSTNSNLVELCENYFRIMWSAAKTEKALGKGCSIEKSKPGKSKSQLAP